MISTFKFNNVFIISSATVSGPKEKEGPLGNYIDYSYDDVMAGTSSFELGESKMITLAMQLAMQKAHLSNNEIDLIIGGDLTNQISSSSEAVMNFKTSFIGVYGACSTSMLSLINSAIFIESRLANNVVSFASSNYGSAERQFRYPLEYGVKKKETATTTVSGSGAIILSNISSKIKVISGTVGRVCNVEWQNPNDMGSAMAYAAFDTILNHLKNEKMTPEDYDLIVTGDLSEVGSKVLLDLFNEYGIEIRNHVDAGNMIYDKNTQKDVYSGGSGCACLSLVGYGYIFNMMIDKKIKDVLLVGTGCLHSKISAAQKSVIPIIAHAVHLRRVE